MKFRSLFFVLVVLLSFWIPKFAQAQQQERPIVRLIYFLPNDREPQPDIDAKLDTLMKDVQQFYADMMEFHGFERKTFQCETDTSGNAVVHHVTGQFTDKHYSSLSPTWDIWLEIEPRFDLSRNIYLTVIDMSSEYLDGRSGRYGQADVLGRRALIPFGKHLEEDFGIAVTAHELGHAFGLLHDYRKNLELGVDIYTTDPMIGSFCTAEWLDAHRAFNPTLLASNKPTNIKVFYPTVSSSSNAIRLRFEISDPDGLHQVQLLVLSGNFGLIDCKVLNGGTHHTVEFVTTALKPEHEYVALNVIDGHGNILRSPNYPIDVTLLLSIDDVFSIPDRNLDALVRERLYLSPDVPLTKRNTLPLLELLITTEIIDFTGLEHVHALRTLKFHGNGIISDLSKLSKLTKLTFLQIKVKNNISDISPLAELTQLTQLLLERNNISDVSPLTELTQLKRLHLSYNNISDVSPLTELTQLTHLHLSYNNISDVSPLAELINCIYFELEGNLISDISSLDGLDENTVISWGGNPGFPRGGPKITGPWLWVTVPVTALQEDIDFLAIASNDETTELKVATIGAKEGLAVGNSRWTSYKISDRGNNINEMIESLGWEKGFVIVYGSIVLEAPEQQQTTMFVGSDDAVKVWLNGKLIHQALVTRAASNYQSVFDVTLKKGKNVLLVAVDNRLGWNFTGFFGFASDAKYTVLSAATSDTFPKHLDVNTDGVINIQDLVLVASNFGQSGQNDADVNGDGLVNIQDLVLVAGAFGETTSAPSLRAKDLSILTATEVKQWLSQAQQLNFTDATSQRGVLFLQQLLVALTPKKTVLLANYPNPFNPETWIPYHLSKDANVTLTIYSMRGIVVRTIALGHKPAGVYTNRSRAIHWDGRNMFGEKVATGVYFYTLTAGDFSATRKMLIWK